MTREERRCVRCQRQIHAQRHAHPWASTHAGRGLCFSCYEMARNRGELPDIARLTRSRDELLDDYVVLRNEGYTWRQCAQKLDMTYPAFERALLRARHDRDPRATRIGENNTLRKAR